MQCKRGKYISRKNFTITKFGYLIDNIKEIKYCTKVKL